MNQCRDISCTETGGSKVGCIPSENEVEGSNPGVLSFFFFFAPFFFGTIFSLGTVCVLSQLEYLDLKDFNYTTELFAAVRRTSMYLYISAMHFCCFCSVLLYCCCCCCICCCSSSCAGWKNYYCGSLHLIPVFLFSSLKHN